MTSFSMLTLPATTVSIAAMPSSIPLTTRILGMRNLPSWFSHSHAAAASILACCTGCCCASRIARQNFQAGSNSTTREATSLTSFAPSVTLCFARVGDALVMSCGGAEGGVPILTPVATASATTESSLPLALTAARISSTTVGEV
jgi:hypothetical protein